MLCININCYVFFRIIQMIDSLSWDIIYILVLNNHEYMKIQFFFHKYGIDYDSVVFSGLCLY